MSDTVFILGAGFSKAIHERMPTLRELSSEVADQFGDAWDPTWGDDLRGNVELLLTYLGGRHPWEAASQHYQKLGAFHQIRELVVGSIERAQSEVLSKLGSPPEWLENLVRHWDRHATTVITFNYDVLVECAFSEAMSDGEEPRSSTHLYPVAITPVRSRLGAVLAASPGPETFTFLKPHGSLTWYFSGSDSPPGDVVYSGYLGGWEPYEPESDRLIGDKETLVVPPLLQKAPFFSNDVLRRQWTLAREAIETAETVTCVGYSLPETDLTTRFLVSTASPHLRIEIVDIDQTKRVERHYRDMLPGFDVSARWTGETAIEDYVTSLA